MLLTRCLYQQQKQRYGIAILLIETAAKIKDDHGNLCLCAELNQQNSNAVLFGMHVALLCCWLNVSISSKKNNTTLLFCWLRLLQRLKIIMGIFACAPSLISKIAMLCCLVCMLHCYVVDWMSLSAAKKQHGIAILLIKIAAKIRDYHGNLGLCAELNQQNSNAVWYACCIAILLIRLQQVSEHFHK